MQQEALLLKYVHADCVLLLRSRFVDFCMDRGRFSLVHSPIRMWPKPAQFQIVVLSPGHAVLWLKQPLSLRGIFNYAFLGHHKPASTVLGENRFTRKPPRASPAFPSIGWAAGRCLQTASPMGNHHRLSPDLGKPSGKMRGRGLRLAQPWRGAGNTWTANLPDSPGARLGSPHRLSRRGSH